MTRRLLAISLVLFALFAVWPASASAQRGRVGVRGGILISPQRTVVYPPWYGPFGPYGGGYGPYQYPYPYRGYEYDSSADLRIEAKPRETEVYVDGSRAGIVDDYDGIFQRLHLLPGDHEITLYLAGYRTWSEHLYFGPRSSHRILHTMLQLAPGQPDEPRPMPSATQMDRTAPRRIPGDAGDNPMAPGYPRNPPPPGQPRNPPPPDRPMNDRPRTDPPQMEPPPDRAMPGSPAGRPNDEPRTFGTLSVGIQPADAEITLDGQKQQLPRGQDRLTIQLSEGVHRLVIQKSGFSTFETDLQIRRGRTLNFNVNLVK